MKHFFKLGISFLGIALAFTLITGFLNGWNFAETFQKKPVLVIDPGHGGIDGGAVSNSNISEKNINLAIALKLQDIAKANGWNVAMTRETDESLGGGEGSIRSQKMKDLAARKKIINEEKNAVAAISIHLNSFPQDSSCKGAQTFFPVEQESALQEQSKLLAECIQSKLIEGLEVEKGRIAMKKGRVYIFKQPQLPVALVECGFLSNPNEEMMLQEDEYQAKLAICIFKGLEAFYQQITGSNLSNNVENIVISDFDDSWNKDINKGE